MERVSWLVTVEVEAVSCWQLLRRLGSLNLHFVNSHCCMKKLPVKRTYHHILDPGYGYCVVFHHPSPGMVHCFVHFVVVGGMHVEPRCRWSLDSYAEKEQVKHLVGSGLDLQKSRFSKTLAGDDYAPVNGSP